MSWNIFKRKQKEEAVSEPKNEVRAGESSSSLKNIIGGGFLTDGALRKYYPYLFLLVLLAFMYIDNRYYCEKQIAKIAELEAQLIDSKYESMTVSSELIQMSRQSQVSETVEKRGLGLKVSTVPAIKID